MTGEDREIWRTIPSLEGYMASSWGRVMRIPYRGQTGRGVGERPYGGVPHWGVWSEDAKRYFFNYLGKNYKVARLICEAFHGPAPADRPNCLHADENSRNNRPENLSWGTQEENLAAPGFLAYATSRTKADIRKLTREQAATIRERVEAGESRAAVAKAFGVSACHVSQICRGNAWAANSNSSAATGAGGANNPSEAA